MIRNIAIFCFFFVITVLQAEEIFPLAQIKSGMKGVTLTVLQGTNIVSLETEILGVSEDYLGPGKDLIIGRLIDEKTKLTGAVHGMSGSPLYIEGKLAGALSRRIAMFEKDGHCGFTPIADMLAVEELQNKMTSAKGFSSGRPFFSFPGKNLLKIGEQGSWLTVPLSFSGVSGYATKILEQLWEGSRFLIAPGGGSGEAIQRGGELQPGSPVSAALLTGDLRIAGTGTLTWRQGSRVLAFGHPMLGLGEVTMPMCEAEIISTIPSYMMPYKLGNVRRVIGTVKQDRLSAIAGIVGDRPVLPRYRVSVQFGKGLAKVYEGNFVSQEDSTPMILASLLIQSFAGNEEFGGEFSIILKGQFGMEDQEPLNFDAFYTGKEEALADVMFDVGGRINRLYQQRLQEIKPEFFDATLEIQPQESKLKVLSIRLEPQRPKAGQSVKVIVKLKPIYGEVQEKSFSLVLPDVLKHGDEGIIEVASGLAFYQQDEGMNQALFSARNLGGETSETLRDLLQQWNRQRSSNELVVRLSNRQDGLRWAEKRLEGLPPSIAEILLAAKPTAIPLSKNHLLEKSVRVKAEILEGAQTSFIVD